MDADLKLKKKIDLKESRIKELKDELIALEKNYEANNRIFMRKYQKNSKPSKKNMFLFHSTRTGTNNNIIPKKKESILFNNNKKNIIIKSYERKKAKSIPKISTYINNKNKNNFFYTNGSAKKNYEINFNVYGSQRGKTLDYKINKNKNIINLNINKHLLPTNNMKQIKVNGNNNISQEISKINLNKNSDNKYNKTEPNINNKNIMNTSLQNKSNKNIENNNLNKQKNLNDEYIFKNIEKQIDYVFEQYFSYYNNTNNKNN